MKYFFMIVIAGLIASCGHEENETETNNNTVSTSPSPSAADNKPDVSISNINKGIKVFYYIPGLEEGKEREISLDEKGYHEFTDVITVNESEIDYIYFRFQPDNEPSKCVGYYEYIVVSYYGNKESITNGQGLRTGESFRVLLPLDERIQPTSTLKLNFKHSCETGEITRVEISMKIMIEGGI